MEVLYYTDTICESMTDDIIIQHDMESTRTGPFYFYFVMPERDVGPNDIIVNAPVAVA